MEKLQAAQLLVEGAVLKAERLNESDLYQVKKLVAETIQKQEDILKLKQVDQETLRSIVVQL